MTTVQNHPATASVEDRASLEAAKKLLLEHDHAGIAALEELHARNPEWQEVLGALAWALSIKGDYERALELYRHFANLSPANIEVRWRAADRLVNLGRLDEAEKEYRAVMADAPDCFDAAMGVRYVQFRRRKEKKGEAVVHAGAPVNQLTDFQKSNKALNDREYADKKLVLKSLPAMMYLESTLKCNFLCKTCSKGYEPYFAEDLKQEVFDIVRNEVMPGNVRISITGFGEPTMAGNFDEILGMATGNGSHVHFVTNASLLSFERLETLLSVPVEIAISFDGGTKATFESIRAGSNFDLTLEKLAMIKKVRDLGLAHCGGRIGFNFVSLRKNIGELPEIVRIAKRYGIDNVTATEYSLQGKEFDEEACRYDPRRSNEMLAEARRLARELGVVLYTQPDYAELPPAQPSASIWNKLRRSAGLFSAKDRFPRRCSSPWSEPYIQVNGEVTPCCASGQRLGNIRNGGFMAVWNGWRYRLLRLRIDSPIPPIRCRVCTVSWGINGGNPGNAMGKEGLIVKACYWSESRFKSAVRFLLNRLNRLRKPSQGAGAQPNFYRGRPMTERNKPEGWAVGAPQQSAKN